MASLKQLLNRKEIVLAAGVYDGLTASLAADAGFEALYLSGASIAYTRLGRPDIGLVTLSEVVDTLALIRDRVTAPLVVDADTGYGNALNAQRTVRLLERAGANAIQLEDQTFPKRCGHLSDKGVIATTRDGRQDQGGDGRARRAGRRSSSRAPTLRRSRVSRPPSPARTPTRKRARTCCSSRRRAAREQLAAIVRAFPNGPPLMANMVEGGRTPILSRDELQALGFSLVIFPGGVVRAIAKAARAFYETLARDGTTDAYRDQMYDFDALNEVIGTPDMLALGRRYEGETR